MVSRKALLAAVSAEENDPFVSLIGQHNVRRDPFDINEAIASLDRKQLVVVWERLQSKCTTALLGFEEEGEDDEQAKGFTDAVAVLSGIVTVAMATIQVENPFVPPELKETAVMLHGVVLVLPESAEKLAASIVQLCEAWWNKQLDGCRDLVGQTLLYLVQMSLQKTNQALVKRVWRLRQTLTHLDIDSESCKTLRSLLLLTVISANYLKSDEGRKFLAFIFRFNENFVEDLHKTIKNQLPRCPRSLMSPYGEVYFNAWRESSGSLKEKIEIFCIQDLMHHSVHGPRGSARSLSSDLRHLLGYLHKQKKQEHTDNMLLRLYEPILWRSLKCANGQVRANAAALLVDAFPLQDPEANVAEVDALLQKQIDILQTMLYDPCPTVRAVVVLGVCHITNVYWEMLPTATQVWFINHLVTDLAWDASSAEVRAAVLKGLASLLDNHLCHPMLKVLLPELCNLLHDSSDLVKVAFLDLLLKVKGIRSIKFWSIAPIEHLLSRLEIDSGAVVRRIMSLLSYSFLPTDKPADIQLSRCVTLLQMNPSAARCFYRYVHEKMPVFNTVKFMIVLCRCLLMCVRKEMGKCSAADGLEEEENDDEEKENEEDDGLELSVSDTKLMAGLLETIVILWEGIHLKLKKPVNADLREKLQQRFSQALPEFFRVFDDPRTCTCLVLLAGFLPPNTIPTFSRSTLSKLRNMEPDNTAADYGALFQSMCRWGKTESVLELVSDWLEPALTITEETPANKSRRKSLGVKFTDPVPPKPQMALLYLTYLLRDAVCRQILLDDARIPVADVTRTLSKVIPRIEERLRSPDPLSELATDEFLTEGFEIYCKLEVLFHDPDNRDHNAVTVLEHLLTWVDTELLVLLRSRRAPKRRLLNQTDMTLLSTTGFDTTMDTTMSTTLQGSKRTARDGHPPALVDMATKITQSLMTVTSNTLLVGIYDHDLLSHIADFTTSIIKSDECIHFVEQVFSLLYQVMECSLSWETEDNDKSVGNHGEIAQRLITTVVEVSAKLARTKKEQAERVLPLVKAAVGQTVQAYFKHHCLNNTLNSSVMATIVAAVIADMTHAIKMDAEFEKCEHVTDLPLLTCFLLSALGRTKGIKSIFLTELCAFVESGAVDTLEGLTSILHIIHTVSQNSTSSADLKECIPKVQLQLDQFILPEDTPEDAPLRHLLVKSQQFAKDCMAKL